MLTRLDRNLLMRVERNLRAMTEDQDKRVTLAITANPAGPTVKAEKLEADRLHRDLRELTALRKRIEAQLPKAERQAATTE